MTDLTVHINADGKITGTTPPGYEAAFTVIGDVIVLPTLLDRKTLRVWEIRADDARRKHETATQAALRELRGK